MRPAWPRRPAATSSPPTGSQPQASRGPRLARVEALDRRRGRRIVLLGALVRLVVRQIGADHDQGLGPAPQALQHFCDLAGRRLADQERHEREVAEHGLEERQLDLERMLGLVRHVRELHLRQVAERVDRILVQRHLAERRAKSRGARHRNAADRHECAGPTTTARRIAEAPAPSDGERLSGDRPGVDVAGMRRDQRLG